MLTMPIFEFIGDDYYEAGTLDKVAIDWSTQTIRGSLTVKPSHNHPNIKKKVQRKVVFFKFSDVGRTLRHLTQHALDEAKDASKLACSTKSPRN